MRQTVSTLKTLVWFLSLRSRNGGWFNDHGEGLERFSKLFNDVVKQELGETALKGISCLTESCCLKSFMHTAETLRAGGPWGKHSQSLSSMVSLKYCIKAGGWKTP